MSAGYRKMAPFFLGDALGWRVGILEIWTTIVVILSTCTPKEGYIFR